MSTIDELKDAYLTLKHEADVVNEKAKEAQIAFYDALTAEKTAEIEAKGIVLNETVVNVSHPSDKNPETFVKNGKFFISGVKVVRSRDDVTAVPVFAAVTKAGKPSKSGSGLYRDDYVYEVAQ